MVSLRDNGSAFEEFMKKQYTGILLGVAQKEKHIFPFYNILILIVNEDEGFAERVGYCEPSYEILRKLDLRRQVIRLG
jgi:hypothetical protein